MPDRQPAYWCIECGLPSDLPPFGRNPDWQCWACRGPVVSQVQLNCWGNLPLRMLLDAKSAVSAATDLLLLDALADDD